MKKTLTLLLTLLILLGAGMAAPYEIWVAPDGNNQNPGSKDKPVATLLMAQRMAREMRRLHNPEITDGINIVLKDGIYPLEEALVIRPEDAGTEISPTVFKAAEKASPTISGGVNVTGWKKLDSDVSNLPAKANGNLYVADIPRVGGHRLAFRQLWVDDVKASKASSLTDGELDRILSCDNLNETLWIPVPDYTFEEIAQLEFVIHQWWAIANLRVKSIEIRDDSAGITFYQPESRVEFEHPWPAPFIDANNEFNGNSAFFFTNSIALLNTPGEWYANEDAGKVYYWPRKGEDMAKAIVTIPSLETLVEVGGTLDNPVAYVNFEGISFKHTSWMRPSYKGHVPLQAGMYLYDAYSLKEPGTPDKSTLENQGWVGRQSAAVTLNGANNITFSRCRFQHLAATGIDFVRATNNNLVKGCLFSDIGGNAIQIGFFGDKFVEAHLPYDPTDQRLVCNNETISNNLITDVTNEDWGCVGINIGYAHDITIEHNEISHINYTGISMGWGWTRTINCMKNNSVRANYIHTFARNMFDVGGVYTLSAQPNSEITENRIERLLKAPYAHIPEHCQFIYYDEGTSYMRSVNNWTEKAIFFENNPGPGNLWMNNDSEFDELIKTNAGLTDDYKDLQAIYKDKSMAKVIENDSQQKTIEFDENYHFQEEGRGPKGMILQKNFNTKKNEQN